MKTVKFLWEKSFLPFVFIFFLATLLVFWSQSKIESVSQDFIKIQVQIDRGTGDSDNNETFESASDLGLQTSVGPQFLGGQGKLEWRELSLAKLRNLSAEFERLSRDNPDDIQTANNYFGLALLMRDTDKIITIREKLMNLMGTPGFESAKIPVRVAILNNVAFSVETNIENTTAEGFYNQALKLQPNWFSYFRLALLEVKKKSLPNAKNLFSRAVQLAKEDDVYLLYYSFAEVLADQKLHDEALGALAKSQQLKSDFWPNYLSTAIQLRRLKRFDEAEKVYNSLLLAQPYYSKAHFNYGILLRSLERLDDAAKEFNTTLLIDDNHQRARRALADLFFDKKDYEKAYTQYKILHNRNLRDPKYPYWLGKIDLITKNYARSETNFRKAIELKGGDYPEAWSKLSDLLLDTGRKDEAIKILEDLIRLKPDYAPAYFDLAANAEKSKKTDVALDWVKTAVKLNPESHVYRRKLANLLEENNDEAGALEQLKIAAASGEKNINTIIKLGELYTRMKNYPEANVQFKIALSLNPNKSVVLFNYANNQSKLNDCRNAIVSYDQSLSTGDKQDSSFIAKILRMRAACKSKLKNFVSAQADLNEALELRENYSEARVDLVQLLIKRGLIKEARSVVMEGLGLDSEDCDLMKIALDNNISLAANDFKIKCEKPSELEKETKKK